jgi:hypothetical protein
MPRKHERFPISLEVVLEFTAAKREARVSDLGMGGCFIDTIVDARPGEAINFKLRLPTEQWIELSAEVIYHFPLIGFGVRFTDLTKEKITLLEQLILACGGLPYAFPDPTGEKNT